MQQPEISPELARIQAEYARRDADTANASRYSLFNEAALLQLQSLERHILRLLKKYGFIGLSDKMVLDAGCGNGTILRRFVDFGADPSRLYGLDLVEQRVEAARQSNPLLNWQVGSASNLPYPDATFDLVTTFMLFSSVLDEGVRREIAGEMWRVLKPGGLILFYDFTFSNPRNPAVKGIRLSHIRQLFDRPGAEFDFRRVTLAPPLARRLAPRARWLADTLEQLRVFNTHTIGIIRVANN